MAWTPRAAVLAWGPASWVATRPGALPGPMALPLFEEWGVRSCLDFGQIVFNLVDAKALTKTDDDKLEDFADGYDFREAFVLPYLPRKGKL